MFCLYVYCAEAEHKRAATVQQVIMARTRIVSLWWLAPSQTQNLPHTATLMLLLHPLGWCHCLFSLPSVRSFLGVVPFGSSAAEDICDLGSQFTSHCNVQCCCFGDGVRAHNCVVCNGDVLRSCVTNSCLFGWPLNTTRKEQAALSHISRSLRLWVSGPILQLLHSQISRDCCFLVSVVDSFLSLFSDAETESLPSSAEEAGDASRRSPSPLPPRRTPSPLAAGDHASAHLSPARRAPSPGNSFPARRTPSPLPATPSREESLAAAFLNALLPAGSQGTDRRSNLSQSELQDRFKKIVTAAVDFVLFSSEWTNLSRGFSILQSEVIFAKHECFVFFCSSLSDMISVSVVP